MKFTFKIWSKIKEAWPLYKGHLGTLLIMMMLTMVAQFIGIKDHAILIVLSFIVSLLVSYIWIRLVLNLVDGKSFNPFTKEALPSLSQFWNFFKTFILSALCILGGFILFIVPAFYISGRLMFVMYLSVEKNQGARATIKEAWAMTKDYGWVLFWKNFLIGLFIALGFVVFFIGSFITYPIGLIVTFMMYREFYKFKMQNPKAPPSPEVVSELPKETIKEEIKH
ncbi:MAG: glycerophosphoryl diester phosphodiesterase membrane domain-containing protein [Candidatus Paceibacterota bacterium]|jgi:uncharacterized membrane protein